MEVFWTAQHICSTDEKLHSWTVSQDRWCPSRNQYWHINSSLVLSVLMLLIRTGLERWICSGLGRWSLPTSIPICLCACCPAIGDASFQTFLSTIQAERRNYASQGSFKARGRLLCLKTKPSLLWRKRAAWSKQKSTSQSSTLPFATWPLGDKHSQCLSEQTVVTFSKCLHRVIFSTSEACKTVSSPRASPHLASSGSSQPSWHSQWQSRNVSMSPFATDAPSSRARTSPSLLLARIRRTLRKPAT